MKTCVENMMTSYLLSTFSDELEKDHEIYIRSLAKAKTVEEANKKRNGFRKYLISKADERLKRIGISADEVDFDFVYQYISNSIMLKRLLEKTNFYEAKNDLDHH